MSSLAFFLLFLRRQTPRQMRTLESLKHRVANLNQPPIGIRREPLIVAAFGQRLHTLIVQAEIEDRIHHARHRKLRA